MKLGLNASEAYKAQLWWAVGHFMRITIDSVKKGNLGYCFSQNLSYRKLEMTVTEILK